MDNREFWLAATLVELADTGEADFSEAAYSGLLATRLAELLAPAQTAVLLADGTGRLGVAAASTSQARLLASFEEDHGDGPATACYRSGCPALEMPIAEASTRWPRFTAAARGAGFETVSALPMRRHDERAGVVSLWRTGRPPLDPTQASLAQILAEAAAIAIMQRRELCRSVRVAEELQHALDSRVLVEQAKGAVAARLGITPEAAFGLLRAFARRHGRPLTEVAAGTIGGELKVTELATVRQAGRAGRSSSPAHPG